MLIQPPMAVPCEMAVQPMNGGCVWMRWSNRQFICIDIQHDKSEWFPILLCLTEDVCSEVRASKRMRWYVNTTTTHYSDAFAVSWANCFGCKKLVIRRQKTLRLTRNRVRDRRTNCIDWEKVSNFTFDLIDAILHCIEFSIFVLSFIDSFADFRFFSVLFSSDMK